MCCFLGKTSTQSLALLVNMEEHTHTCACVAAGGFLKRTMWTDPCGRSQLTQTDIKCFVSVSPFLSIFIKLFEIHSFLNCSSSASRDRFGSKSGLSLFSVTVFIYFYHFLPSHLFSLFHCLLICNIFFFAPMFNNLLFHRILKFKICCITKACLLNLLIGTTEDSAANNISKLQSVSKVAVG